MQGDCNDRPPYYANPGQAVVGGTSWTKLVGPNARRRAITFGRGSVGGDMRIGGEGGSGLIMTLNNENPSIRLDWEQYGDLVQGGWYVNTNGSSGLVVTWTEQLCWPC